MIGGAVCGAQLAEPGQVVVLRAARMLDVEAGKAVAPGLVVIRGDRIVAVGGVVDPAVAAGAQVIDLGDRTLMPGMIDAHVHLFLHPGAEDLQTVEEGVPQRVLAAAEAARADLQAGFTAERDMGTEGAGSADTAVRDAIDAGVFPGPRMRVSGNAISILGGHEDAIGYNVAQKVMGNADYANTAAELVAVIRQQRKEGADFTKVYETGQPERAADDGLAVPYQYTVEELKTAVGEAARISLGKPGHGVAVHAEGEPGTGYAVEAGVMSGGSCGCAVGRDDGGDEAEGDSGGADVCDSGVLRADGGERGAQESGARFAGAAQAGVPTADGGGCSVCGGQRCGAVSAWHAGARDGADGRVRDAGGGGAAGRSVERGEAAGVGGADG